MASSQLAKPVFPPEVWQTVFSNLRRHHGLVHLWTDCRHVCRQFRDDVERIFSIKHLTKTTITFDCGVWYNPEAFGGKVNLRSIPFTFDRLANEGETAVFKIEDCAEEFMPEIMQRVSYCIATSSIERPGHLVCFRGVVNDTEVPDVAVDEESRQISFDWRAMFSQYFAEEKLSSYHIKHYLSDGGIGMIEGQKLQDKMDRGQADTFETMKASLAIAERAFDESKKSARRARIRRLWEAEGQDCVFDEEFEEEEKTALETLKDAQFSANFLEFSDDEGEAESESASRRNGTTAKEEDEEDDENAMYEGDDDQDVDDDEDVEEESDEDADYEGGVGFGHHHEN